MLTLKEKIRDYALRLDGRTLPLGLGCAWLGRHMEDDAQVTKELRLMDDAFENGFRYLDTSCDYGDSELLLGKWLSHVPRNEVFLATKGRYEYRGGNALEGLKRNFYESFERLHVDHIDFYMIHDADAYGRVEEEALPFLLERKAEHMIDHIGQGTRDNQAHIHAVLGGVMEGVLSYLQFNLVNTSSKFIADKAAETGTAFINGSPLAGGVLIHPKLGKRYARNREDIAFGEKMRALLEKIGVDVIAAALQFPLLFPQIDITLNGIATDEDLRSTINALRTPIHSEQWRQIFELQKSYRYIDVQTEYNK